MRFVGALLVVTGALCAGHSFAGADETAPLPLDRQAASTRFAATSALMAIARAGSRLVAVGERGIVIVSDDDGKNWRQVKVAVSVTLTDVSFAEADRGWITGHAGVLLHSVDRGETWHRVLDGRHISEMVLRDVEARVRAAGEDIPFDLEIEHMRADAAAARPPSDPLFAVHFLDRDNGLAVGAFGRILRTRDGGKQWEPQKAPSDDLHLYAIRQIGGRVYIVGESGTFLRGRSDELSFEALATPHEGTFFGVVPLAKDQALLAFGLNGHGVAASKGSDGLHWRTLPRMNGTSLTNGTLLPDGRIVLSAVDGTLRISDDGGLSFQVLEPEPLAPLNDLTLTAQGRIAAVGMAGVRIVEVPPRRELGQ